MDKQDVAVLLKELQDLKHQFGESQWFLGEEKTKRQQVEDMLQGCQQRIQHLEGELHAVRDELDRVRKDLQDSQWFLGEEKARRHELEEELRKKIG